MHGTKLTLLKDCHISYWIFAFVCKENIRVKKDSFEFFLGNYHGKYNMKIC